MSAHCHSGHVVLHQGGNKIGDQILLIIPCWFLTSMHYYKPPPLLTHLLHLLCVTGPAKIGHVGSQNPTTFQTFVTHNFLLQYGMATQFSEIVHNLTGFLTHLKEPKYYISVLIYVSSNNMVYFSPHALFSQAQSHIVLHPGGPVQASAEALLSIYVCCSSNYLFTLLTPNLPHFCTMIVSGLAVSCSLSVCLNHSPLSQAIKHTEYQH